MCWVMTIHVNHVSYIDTYERLLYEPNEELEVYVRDGHTYVCVKGSDVMRVHYVTTIGLVTEGNRK